MATAVLQAVPVTSVESRVTTLAGVLADLDIAVFPLADVESFKKRARAKALLPILLMGSVVALGCTAIGILCFWGVYQVKPDLASQLPIPALLLKVVGMFLLTMLGICITGFGMMNVLSIRNSVGEIRWAERRVGTFYDADGIPDEALENARRIHRALLGTRFTVDELGQDPFLYVSHEGAKYCIAHWGEPGFEG